MEYIGLGLSFIGFLIALWVWRRSVRMAKSAQAAQDALAEELRTKMNAHADAERRASKLDRELREMQVDVSRLEKELAAAVARRDEKAIARAMWSLELERTYRQWRDVLVPTDATRKQPCVTEGQQLRYALGQEVERLREEVGVAISLDGELQSPLDPEVALGALRMTEEALAIASKRADDVRVTTYEQQGESFVVHVQGEGWEEGSVAESEETEEFVRAGIAMAARLDGTLEWTVLRDVDDETLRDVNVASDGSEDAAIVEILLCLPIANETIEVADAGSDIDVDAKNADEKNNKSNNGKKSDVHVDVHDLTDVQEQPAVAEQRVG